MGHAPAGIWTASHQISLENPDSGPLVVIWDLFRPKTAKTDKNRPKNGLPQPKTGRRGPLSEVKTWTGRAQIMDSHGRGYPGVSEALARRPTVDGGFYK